MRLRDHENRRSRRMFAATKVIAVSLIGAGLAAAQPATSDKPLLAEQVFKNIQALRGISVDDFLQTMGLMTAALQFDCADCHTNAGTNLVDWAADTPRKVMARRMVNMVATINKTNFGGRQMVTCWTCHRNRDKPLVTPTMDVMYGTPDLLPDDVIQQVQGLPSADAILNKYIQASGGAERLASLTSLDAKGTSVGFGGFGGGGDVEIVAKFPDKRSTIILFKAETGRGDQIRAYDGSTGWVRTPLNVVGEFQLGGGDLDGARFDAQLSFPGQIKQILTNLKSGPPTSITDLPAPSSQSSLEQNRRLRPGTQRRRGSRDRAKRPSGHSVFRQADGLASAGGALWQLADRSRSDPNRFRGLSRRQRHQITVPNHLRVAGRTRCNRASRD